MERHAVAFEESERPVGPGEATAHTRTDCLQYPPVSRLKLSIL